MNSAQNQVYLYNITPIQAFNDSSLDQQSLVPPADLGKANGKRKKGSLGPKKSAVREIEAVSIDEEEELRKKLSASFEVLRNVKENLRLRRNLDGVHSSIRLYEEYKKQQKRKGKKAKI